MCWLGLASDRSSSLHSDTTGTTESTGSLKVSENVQSDIWDNRGEFQPGLSYAHLLLYIFGSRLVPRSNSQTFSVPEQILFDLDLEHSSNTDTACYWARLLSHRHSPTGTWGARGCTEPPAAWKHPWHGRTSHWCHVRRCLQGWLYPGGLLSSESFYAICTPALSGLLNACSAELG